MNKQKDTEKVLALSEGQECYIHWFEESGAKVVLKNGLYELYEVSSGGAEWYYQSYHRVYISALVDHAYTWN